MVAAVDGGGIWVSADFGSSWTLSTAPSPSDWVSVTSSSDGRSLAAVIAGAGIWISTNSGTTWDLTSAPTNLYPRNQWDSISSSADGTRMAACQYGPENVVYSSSNGGRTWQASGQIIGGDNFAFAFVTVSAGGNFIAVDSCCEGTIYVSTNFGATWQIGLYAGYWGQIASSFDGSKIMALQGANPIYASADFGSHWSPVDAPQEDWVSIILSADGDKAAVATSGGGIYIWQPEAPFIASQPQNQTILGGLTGRLDAGAFSAAPVTYQWQFDGTNLTDATNSSLVLTSLSPSDGGTYTVIVRNTNSAVTSSNAVLTVAPAFVSTLPANWGMSDAILGGSASTGSNATVVWFNWGLTTNYGNITLAYPIPNVVVSLDFSNRITGLAPYATYHYQSVASNALGAVTGGDASFTTAPRFVETPGPNGFWTGLSWSADGSKMFASSNGMLYLSTMDGATWKAIGGPNLPIFLPSADGTKLAGLNGNVFYLMTKNGASWPVLSNNTPTNFSALAGSADLGKLIAIGGGQLYVSTNAGASWTLTGAPKSSWASVASSADGSEFAGLIVELGAPLGFGEGYVGFVYLSTNSGPAWSNIATFDDETYVSSIACSADGTTLAFVAEYAYFSSNSGKTWQTPPALSLANPISAACSADGKTILLANSPPPGKVFYVSPDFGADWYPANGPSASSVQSVLVSTDGTKFAVLDSGSIYISEANPPPTLNVAISGGSVLLSWMQPVSNFILQQSADLVTWSNVTNAPQLNITNLQNQVALPLSPSQTFFRLREP